jgi:hypothetical protein
VLAIVHISTAFLLVALIAIYIRDIFKTNRVDKDKKALWAVCIFLGNMVAIPIYWFLYIWKEPKSADSQTPTP